MPQFEVYNKRVLAVFPKPLTLGSVQLLVGALYVVTVWKLGLRSRPKLHVRSPFVKVGICNALGQLCTMASLGVGSVAFTNIVKVANWKHELRRPFLSREQYLTHDDCFVSFS